MSINHPIYNEILRNGHEDTGNAVRAIVYIAERIGALDAHLQIRNFEKCPQDAKDIYDELAALRRNLAVITAGL